MFLFKGDGCTNYKVLNEADRAQGNALLPQTGSDDNLGTGWYRFQGAAGDRMADKCVVRRRCGTERPGWLFGAHPTVAEVEVTRKVCYTSKGQRNCCGQSNNITVKNCSEYYVYELKKTPDNARYCGNAGAGKLH